MEQSPLESRLAELERKHRDLAAEIESLRRMMAVERQQSSGSAPVPVKNSQAAPPMMPPPLPASVQARADTAATPPPPATPAPPPRPAPISERVEAPVAREDVPVGSTEELADSESPAKDPFELRLGRVWLARLGILMVVTGFVFLCNYAYRGFIAEWPPVAKVAALLVVALSLVPLGHWLAASRESLRRFGRVVAAGGCALVYYTAFAAHHVERLRVIDSPALAGILLTLVAAGIVGYARWQRAPALALGALVLAFASVASTPLGWFAVVALTVLAVAALALVPQIGVAAGWVSLLGTFGAYAFWQGWVLQSAPDQNPGRWPLLLWWLLHLAAAMPGARPRAGEGAARAGFLLANHTALVFLFAFDWSSLSWTPQLGMVLLCAAVVVLSIAVWAWRKEGRDSVLVAPHLAQGLAFLALGLAVELHGYQLFLALAVKGVVLLALAQRIDQTVTRVAGLLATTAGAALGLWHAAVVPILETIASHPPRLAMTGLALALIAAAVVANRDKKLAAPGQPLTPGLFFCSLAVLVCWLGVTRGMDWGWVILAGVGLALEAGPARLKAWRANLPDSTWPGRAALTLAAFALAGRAGFGEFGPVRWVFLVGAALLALSILLRRDWELDGGTVAALFCHLHALLMLWIFALYAEQVQGEVRAAFGTLPFASAVLVLGASRLRLPALRLQAHWLLLPAFVLIFHPPADAAWWEAAMPLLPLAALLALCKQVDSESTRFLYFAGTAVYFSLWWIGYVPHPWLGLAALVLLLSLPTVARRLAVAGQAVALVLGAAALAAMFSQAPGWTHHAAVALLLVARVLARPGGAMSSLTATAIIIALFYFVTEHAAAGGLGVWRAALWSLTGFVLLAGGLAANDRPQRIGGLAILGVALAHAAIVDVWKFSSLVRIVSFTGLGVALLLAGYGYNRWHERVRKLF